MPLKNTIIFNLFYFQASFFKQFIEGGNGYDLDENAINNRTDDLIAFRQKTGISIDECARLCLFEPAFTCSVMSYSDIFMDCKWASFPQGSTGGSTTDLVLVREKYSFFVRDPLYDYFEYPLKVTSVFDFVTVEVSSKAECAYACNDQKKIRCRSFNLCRQKISSAKFDCLLSETNLYSSQKDPTLVETNLCSHFSSRRNINLRHNHFIESYFKISII